MKLSQAPAILYSCHTEKNRSGESFISEHCVCYIQSGIIEFQLPDQNTSFKEGEAFFVSRNTLARSVKYPAANAEFKSITVLFGQDMLKNISVEKKLEADDAVGRTSTFTRIDINGLLKNYFESLPAYEGAIGAESLIGLKVEEGVLLLLNAHSELKHILFNFNVPGRIDLEVFMNKNFRFNVEMKHFATLTGRSLATFKRDFIKTFNTSPNRWLQKKRLEEARYLIKEKGRKPSDVYLEVGFEDLSHFSFAFKKNYGVAPSQI